MKLYFNLVKVMLKCGSNQQNRNSSRANMSGLAGILISLACLTPMVTMMSNTARAQYRICQAEGTQSVLLWQSLSMGILVSLIFGLSLTVTTFYISKDITLLMALPLKAETIAAAKWTVCLTYSYLMIYCMTFPQLLGYGQESGAGPVYWIMMLAVCLLLPMMPQIYDAILMMLIMRIFKRIRNKKLLQILCMAISGVVVVVVLLNNNRVSSGSGTGGSKALNSLYSGITVAFPNTGLAEQALEKQSVWYLLAFLATILLGIAVMLVAARLVYFKSVIGMTEARSGGGTVSARNRKAFAQTGSGIRAYAKVERKMFFRSPTYVMNCLLVPLIMPVVMMVNLFLPSSAEDDGLNSFVFSKAAESGSAMAVLITSIIFIFLTAGLNMMIATSISREGSSFYFMKCIPIGYRSQLIAKVRSGIFLLYGMTAAAPLILAGAAVYHGMTPVILVCVLLLAIPALVFVSYVQLFFDLQAPNLAWEDEKSVITQKKLLLCLFVTVIAGAVFATAGALLFYQLQLPLPVVAFLIFCALSGVAWLTRNGVLRYGERKIKSLMIS